MEYTKADREKIALYEQMLKLKIEYANLKNGTNNEFQGMSDRDITQAINHTRPELKTDIDRVEQSLSALKYTKATELAMQTDEYKAAEMLRDSKMAEVCTPRKKYIEQSNAEIQQILQVQFGDLVGSRLTSGGQVNIGILATDGPQDDVPGFKFGLSFDITLDHEYTKWSNNKAKKIIPKLNYGTMGWFNPLEDSDRVLYLSVMSWVASNQELMNKLVEIGTKLEELNSNIYAKTSQFRAQFSETTKSIIEKYM